MRNHELLTCLPEPVNGLGYAPQTNGGAYQTSSQMPWEVGYIGTSGNLTLSNNINWPTVRYVNVTYEPGDPIDVGTFLQEVKTFLTGRLYLTEMEIFLSSETFNPVQVKEPLLLLVSGGYTQSLLCLIRTGKMILNTSLSETILVFKPPVTVTLGSWAPILFPQSRFWDGYLNYEDPAPDSVALFQTNPNTNFYSFIDGKAGMGGRTEERG